MINLPQLALSNANTNQPQPLINLTGQHDLLDVLVPCVALVEALYIAEQEQGRDAAAERFALIEALPIVILWSFDADVVRNAARVKAGHRVSLGDALMAGLPCATVQRCCTKTPSSSNWPTC